MRQWKKWQKFADIVGLPQEYRTSDPQTDDEKQTNFILSCRSDLMKHVTTGDTAIRTARAHFLRESKIAEEKLIIDCPVLNRFNKVLNRFNTFPVSITQYRRGCVLQQHCCPIQISVKS